MTKHDFQPPRTHPPNLHYCIGCGEPMYFIFNPELRSQCHQCDPSWIINVEKAERKIQAQLKAAEKRKYIA